MSYEILKFEEFFDSKEEFEAWQQSMREVRQCQEEIFVRMLATLEGIAEANHDEDFAEWAQEMPRAMVKMARGES